MITTAIMVSAIFAVAITTYSIIRSRGKSASKSSFADSNVYLAIKVPKENEKDALAAEQMFASLHGLLKLTPQIQEHVSFEIASSSQGVQFYCVTPEATRAFVESQIYAQYPNAQISEVEDYTKKPFEGKDGLVCRGSVLKVAKDQIFPIKTFRDFEVDPLSAVTSAIADLRGSDQVWIQIIVRPEPDGWQQEGYDYINALQEGTSLDPVSLSLAGLGKDVGGGVVSALKTIPQFFFKPGHLEEQREELSKTAKGEGSKLSAGQTLEIKAIEEKMTRMGFFCNIRVLGISGDEQKALSNMRAAAASFKQFSTANLNSFQTEEVADGEVSLGDFQGRSFDPSHAYVLTIDELASVFHLPSVTVETPAISWSAYKRGESPLNLPITNCTYFGKTTFRNQLVDFGIKNGEDRFKHMYLIGKTGVGKSTLFYNMVKQDMENGKGVGVIDPHGETVDHIIDLVPKDRIEDVVYFDPSDAEHPVSLNMFENPDPAQKNLMASGLVAVFQKYFGYSWGPRLEYLLNNAILTLLDVPNTTLLGVTRLLADDNYRKYITYKLKDPLMKKFWEEEYRDMKGNQRLITEALSPIQNKVGRFLSSTTIRNILGQAKSTIKLDDVMDNKKILLVNLAKGKIGEDNSNLLGAMIINRLEFMAMQRSKIPYEERVPFYLFVDEFQNFASESFASILSEARKYKLALHLTHQYTAQLPQEMIDGVFGNVGTIVSFALGAPDAGVLAPEFEPVFDANDLISLEAYHIYVKLMIDGMTSLPFSASTFSPPKAQDPSPREEVIASSREKYGTDVKKVEEKIDKWFNYKFDLGKAIAEGHRDSSNHQTSPKVELSKKSQSVSGEIDFSGADARGGDAS
jgi:hypothetical protein